MKYEGLKVISECIYIPPKTLVSKRSRYRDIVWTWVDPSNPRLGCYREQDLTINWEKAIHRNLTVSIIEGLKKFAFFRYACSRTIFLGTNGNAHPSAVVAEINVLVNFLSHLRRKIVSSGVCLINDLSDISISDLEIALESYPLTRNYKLKSVLIKLGSEEFSRNFGAGRMKWNKSDIDVLWRWRSSQKSQPQRLPDEIFSALSIAAAKDVKCFLYALEISCHDTSSFDYLDNPYIKAVSNFKVFFEEYVKYKHDPEMKGFSYRKWKIEWGDQLEFLCDLIERARIAAQIIIMLYTGARISEFTGFRRGCLICKGDYWVILGTLVKGRDENTPVGRDEWVAIAIVRDAVHVLEQTAKLSASEFLFHGSRVSKKTNVQMDSSRIVTRINKYIGLIDAERNSNGKMFYPSQFRNSFVYQLQNSGLDVSCISQQLKHSYDPFGHSISDTTLHYGSLGDEAVVNAVVRANQYSR